MAKKIALELDVDVVVQITENHGEYHVGRCLACDESGWLTFARHGYPFPRKSSWSTTQLRHKENCQMNVHLNDDGSLRE